MNQFFKSVLSTVVGIFLFNIFVAIMLFIGLIGSLALSSSSTTIENNSVLVLKLSGTLSETAGNNFLGKLTGNNLNELGLNQLRFAIKEAGKNDDIKGIYLEGGILEGGYASLQELRNLLSEFKKTGKWIVAYADEYTQGAYYVASVANDVLINPQGSIDWHGLSAQPMFVKDATAKIGIKYNVIKVGKYKSATEMYTEEKMSDANKEQVGVFINGTWKTICKDVAQSRNVNVDSLNAYADRLIGLEETANLKKYHLVDALLYSDEVKGYINKKLGQETEENINRLDLTQMVENKSDVSLGDQIAVYYASGAIVQENVGGMLAGESSIVATTVCKDLEQLMNDDNIKAVVLRVNSGGGDAYASEQIWHQVAKLKEKKPVVVSMGDYAASGAYYFSSVANWIVAQPTTLTGSIGIFGVIPDFSGLTTEKLGLKFDVVQTNKNSSFGNIYARSLNQSETMFLRTKIENGYKLFKKRVESGRKMTPNYVEDIAQGRVWLGTDARRVGLVDALGGIDDAIVKAALLAKVTDYTLTDYPKTPSWLESLESEANRTTYIDDQLRATLGIYYEPLMMVRSLHKSARVQAQLPFVLNVK